MRDHSSRLSELATGFDPVPAYIPSTAVSKTNQHSRFSSMRVEQTAARLVIYQLTSNWWRRRELNPQDLLAKQACDPSHIPISPASYC